MRSLLQRHRLAHVAAAPVRLASTAARQSNIAQLLRRPPATTVDAPGSGDGDTVTVAAFVRTVRKQKRVAFAALGDGSSLESLQVVMKPELAAGLSTGVGVTVSGQWLASPSGKQQASELRARTVQILGQNDPDTYPLQKKYHSPKFLRTLPHLRTRLPFNSLMLRLRSQVIAHVTHFFAKQDFVQTHPPIITSSDCEGAGEVFTVSANNSHPTRNPVEHSGKHEDHFFRSPKYLTVSSQLHLEALAQSVGKVWTLSPTFRAERSDTPRHLSEFYMLEAELGFAERHDEVMDVVESMLRDVARSLKESNVGRELLLARSSDRTKDEETTTISPEALSQRWEGLIRGPWPRLTHAEAVTYLQDAAAQGQVVFEFQPSFDDGLQAEHERYLADNIGQGGPVFVTDYPRAVKPFYMAPSRTDSARTGTQPTVACFDLLVPEICELAGGSMREHRLTELMAAMNAPGLRSHVQPDQQALPALGLSKDGAHDCVEPEDASNSSDLQWYLDLRRYGSVPHGGFGIGFDRLLGYLSGVSNIRDVVGFPRWYQRCDC